MSSYTNPKGHLAEDHQAGSDAGVPPHHPGKFAFLKTNLLLGAEEQPGSRITPHPPPAANLQRTGGRSRKCEREKVRAGKRSP